LLAPLEPIVIDAIEAAVILEMMYKLRRATMLWGPPGIGKSELYFQVAKKLGIQIIDFRALTRNPVDISGMPFVLFSNGKGKVPSREPTQTDSVGYTVWSKSDIIQLDGEGIIFLDEINAALPAVQAALYQLILDRRIGNFKLGDGWAVMCAGNRTSDKGVTYHMPSPLSDRLQHYDLTCKFDPWMTEYAIPHNVHPLICGYLKLREKYDIEDTDIAAKARGNENPNPFQVTTPPPSFGMAQPQMPSSIEIPEHCGMLLRFNPKERSFPTPRSWSMLSEELYEIEKAGLTGSNIEAATFAGKVGRVAGTELGAFANVFRAGFSVERILRDPDKAPAPQDPGMNCAVASALSRVATPTNIDAIMQYGERALAEEFLIMMVKDAERVNGDLTATAAYRDFGVKHAAAMS
jgi:hypothetical protein